MLSLLSSVTAGQLEVLFKIFNEIEVEIEANKIMRQEISEIKGKIDKILNLVEGET